MECTTKLGDVLTVFCHRTIRPATIGLHNRSGVSEVAFLDPHSLNMNERRSPWHTGWAETWAGTGAIIESIALDDTMFLDTLSAFWSPLSDSPSDHIRITYINLSNIPISGSW